MFSLRRFGKRGRLLSARPTLTFAFCGSLILFQGSIACAAINSSGDISPVPPSAGGAVAGPLHIGNVDVATMTINTSGGPSPLTNTNSVLIGETNTGIGIVNMSGFGSDWTLVTTNADMTVGLNGAGSVNLSNLAFLSVNDDLFVAANLNSLGEISISGLGTIVDVGDIVFIGQRGQAVIEISNGGRLVSDQNIIGAEPAGDGRVTLSDPFSLWRTTNTLHVADNGRGLLQIFDGARVETGIGLTASTVGNVAGSTGMAEIVGLGSLWDISSGLKIGAGGTGSLIIADGGRVNSGSVTSLTTLGDFAAGNGRAEVRGADSLWSVRGNFEVGNTGTGTLRILEGGRVTSGISILGENTQARGVVLVDGDGSRWDLSGALDVGDFGEAHLTVSNGGVVHTSSIARVAALGKLTLDDGRLEIETTPVSLTNAGVIDGNGTIEAPTANNVASGRIRPQGAKPLLFTGTLTNFGTIDVQSGILEVAGLTINNLDIDARDGAILRFRVPTLGLGLDNNSGSQLAITSGVVDVFGTVDNNVGAEIAVGGTAVAVFHDAVTNNGTIFVQPGGEVFMLENLGFTPSSAFSVALQAFDPTDPDTEPSDGFGQLQISDSAALDGTLEVSLLNGFMPMAGDAFQILTASGGRTGVFSNEILPALSGGLNWDVQYNPNSVVLSVIGAILPGDYNGDGRVDAADYVVWRKNDGSQAGYDTWRTNFGRSAAATSTGSSTAAPEPGLMALLACAVVMLMCRPRPILARRAVIRGR